MTVKRRPQGKGKGKSRGRKDALTFEEWKRRKTDEKAGAAAAYLAPVRGTGERLR